jgi:spermidine synthase
MLKLHGLKLTIVGLSSACGLIVEIVAGRMIAPYLGMSLYTWTAVIAVVLAGFSLGHWIGGLLAERPSKLAMRGVAWSLLFAAISTVATLIIIRVSTPLIIGFGLGAVPTVLIVTGLLFFLPSVFIGIPSPVLTKLAIDADAPDRSGRTIGAFYAISAVGSIVGTLLAGFLFISWFGTTTTILIVASLYSLMATVLFVDRLSDGIHSIRLPLVVALAALSVVTYSGTTLRAFSDPCRVGSSYYCIRVQDISQEYGAAARVMVLDHLGHGVNLRDAPERLVSPYVELQDTLARIHSGKHTPFRVFFVGGGAYTLPRAWSAARPDADIIVAEIDPVVTATAKSDMWLAASPNLKSIHLDARVALIRQAKSRFDVIVGDAFHDIVIPQHLVTSEFFELVASRLKNDGIYLMNIVDHRHRPRLALSVYETVKRSFTNVELWVSSEQGTRSTFVLAAVRKPTPYGTLNSRATPGITFQRIKAEQLRLHHRALRPIILTDDFAPVDRLIGIE